jgi:hypothetical protein
MCWDLRWMVWFVWLYFSHQTFATWKWVRWESAQYALRRIRSKTREPSYYRERQWVYEKTNELGFVKLILDLSFVIDTKRFCPTGAFEKHSSKWRLFVMRQRNNLRINLLQFWNNTKFIITKKNQYNTFWENTNICSSVCIYKHTRTYIYYRYTATDLSA